MKSSQDLLNYICYTQSIYLMKWNSQRAADDELSHSIMEKRKNKKKLFAKLHLCRGIWLSSQHPISIHPKKSTSMKWRNANIRSKEKNNVLSNQSNFIFFIKQEEDLVEAISVGEKKANWLWRNRKFVIPIHFVQIVSMMMMVAHLSVATSDDKWCIYIDDKYGGSLLRRYVIWYLEFIYIRKCVGKNVMFSLDYICIGVPDFHFHRQLPICNIWLKGRC